MNLTGASVVAHFSPEEGGHEDELEIPPSGEVVRWARSGGAEAVWQHGTCREEPQERPKLSRTSVTCLRNTATAVSGCVTIVWYYGK